MTVNCNETTSGPKSTRCRQSRMPYPLLGLGATSYVTTTDNTTVLKGHQVWRDGKYYMGRDDCEDDLAREAAIYAHLGEHPQILKCFGLEEHCAGVHSLRWAVSGSSLPSILASRRHRGPGCGWLSMPRRASPTSIPGVCSIVT